MGAFTNFRTSNSRKVLNTRDENRVGDTLKILSTLQDRQDKNLAKRDETDAVLEDVQVSDVDKPAWEKFKAQVKAQLATVPDSAYIGDMDRQINKIANKAMKGVQEVQGNYKRKSDYYEEGKKLGLDDTRISQHTEMSSQKGGLQYDEATGQFNNRFQGIAYTKPVSQENINEAIKMMKPTVVERRVGNQMVKETIFDPDSKANQSVFEYYSRFNPEFQKELQFQNEYAKIKAQKLDTKNITPEAMSALSKEMKAEKLGNLNEAYYSLLKKENSKTNLGLLYSTAKLRTQYEKESKLAEEAKMRIDHQYDMELMNAREDREDNRADKKTKAEEGVGLLTDDIVRSKYEGDLVNGKTGALEERGLMSRVGSYLANTLWFPDAKQKANATASFHQKYNLGEAGHNYMLNTNTDYRQLEAQKAKANKKQADEISTKQEELIRANEDKVALAIQKAGTMRSPKLITPTTKKQRESGEQMLESILGRNIGGGSGDGLAIREITEGKEGPETTVGTLRGSLGKRATISTQGKEREKLDEDGQLVYEGMSGFDGTYMNGMRFSITDDGGEKRQFVVKIPEQNIPLADQFSRTKQGNYIHREGLSKVQSHFRAEGLYNSKQGMQPVKLEKHGDKVRVIDNNDRVIDTVTIDSDANIVN